MTAARSAPTTSPRRPIPGMLLHIDGSQHRWFQDERQLDLIVILDDATNEIYYARLVEQESTKTPARGPDPAVCLLRRSHFV